ncbi:Zinc finger protein 658B [Papilio machaon]|uniref:Zinc finger protein 658B n=1 Tax=Papilio machaon TaxID=76193 RepID=A0A0N1IQA1_PAPMA|nr:Zinc finger protein 658B [Papilio machaon]
MVTLNDFFLLFLYFFQDKGNYVCNVCKQRMDTDEKLFQHKKLHQIRYKCLICGITQKTCMRDHYNSYHSKVAVLYKCKSCPRTFTDRYYLRKHVTYRHKDRRVTCAHCMKTYANKDVLKNHIQLRHPTVFPPAELKKSIVCNECGKAFKSPSQLKAHSLKHSSEKKFYCVECDKSFKSENTLKQHLKLTARHVNPSELQYLCTQCDRRFGIKRDLERHMNRIHLNIRPYKCDLCEKAFNNSWCVKKHKKISHEGYKRPYIFPCTMCDKIFDTEKENKEHYKYTNVKIEQIENEDASQPKFSEVVDNSDYDDNLSLSFIKKSKEDIHKNEKMIIISNINAENVISRTYKVASDIVRHGRVHDDLKVPCKFRCGYSTVYKGALKQHEKRHKKEYTYTCDKCNKGFEVLTWYEQHQNIHTGDKPFVCNICGVAFHMDRYLQVHIRSVHPQSYVSERFLCVHCSKPCSSKKALTLHLKEHGITSKFLCDICGKVFSEARLLRIHKRMHLGIRPYSCSICKKTFAKRSNLTVHAQTHSGERSHACESCGKRYTQRGTLLRHVQRFHKGTSLEVVRNET